MQTQNATIYYRLIALWVLCEALLGSVIHGLRIPVSGLIVGSTAVICISLIAWYAPQKGAILKATIVVAVFKMMLSPQASFPAYIAVFFQGGIGELVFWNRKNYRLSCMILGLLALLESGLQRILVLTIIYGNELWVVVNDFINGLTRQAKRTNYSLWIGTVYVGMHLLTGWIIGWFSGNLPRKIEALKINPVFIIDGLENVQEVQTGKKRRKRRGLMIIVWFFLLCLFLQAELSIGKPLLPSGNIVRILIRSLLIIFGWMLIIGPLLNQILHSWLTKKQVRWKEEILAVNSILPSIRTLVLSSWKRSSSRKYLLRLREFAGILLVNLLRDQARVHILSAPIQSGKTTRLLEWIRSRKNVAGILTPVRDGKRYFLDISTGEEFPMEAAGDETEIISIGKFKFSKNNFSRAIQVLKRDIGKQGWLIVDEVGPIELKGEGFAEILTEMIAERSGNILLVVREGLLQNVVKQFGIMSYETVTESPFQEA